MDYKRIVTHDDFDGMASAVLCAFAFNIDSYALTGPRTVNESRMVITPDDIVCDLPYPLECGLWFDHHPGNLEDMKLRGIDPAAVPGAFSTAPSCARVVYDYLDSRRPLPDRFLAMVEEADIIDSFSYTSIQEWREESPGKIIEKTLRSAQGPLQHKHRYIIDLIRFLRERPLKEAAHLPEVIRRYDAYQHRENEMLDQIKKNAGFLSQDRDRELIILDFTKQNHPPRIIKHLAYLLYPQAMGVLEIRPIFRRGVKTNDLSISMSLSLNMNHRKHTKDLGQIIRDLNIGDGHKGAGAGLLKCSSKQEMLRQKDRLLNEIFRMWKDQQNG
jgi:hypothetical protein